LFATVISGRVFRELDASVGASGPHDFAVRIRRASSLRAISVHRIPPHVRDDRETPLIWDGTKSVYFCFYPGVKHNFGNSEIYLRIPFSFHHAKQRGIAGMPTTL
jgi:hypothetical protein